jgi:hypothetical protein
MFKAPEMFRLTTGSLGSDESFGNNGCFTIPFESYEFMVIASDGDGWEHVSISLNNRTPNWREMCFIKSIFWSEEDCVVQYHPPKTEYVNNHPHCLHLWRPINTQLPMPPSILVGIKDESTIRGALFSG